MGLWSLYVVGAVGRGYVRSGRLGGVCGSGGRLEARCWSGSGVLCGLSTYCRVCIVGWEMSPSVNYLPIHPSI